ncbi:MAG: M48 family metallopeptidase [Candidatus Scatosoma sp.]
MKRAGDEENGAEGSALPFTYKTVLSPRKTLSVSVDRLGRVTLRAPARCGEKRILSFLREKSGWVQKQIARAAAALPAQGLPQEAKNGVTFPLFGKTVTVSLLPEGAEKKAKAARLSGDTLYLPADEPETRLVRFLKKTAKEFFQRETQEAARRMGATYASVSVNGAKTRWGSCSYNNKLHFSYRLIYAEEEVARYVIVHELAHTFEQNHSARFWAIVEKYEPQYKAKRAYLKEHACYMEIF